ncbi:hypothetical protein [Solimicrobium silvestre]|uniref:Bacterial extracellular solute-binding protein, family 3 n=1 Tax=Solimicrobium silvestre TaxID=2099400 RepID=A0A2S9H568_9BURK|nr:hypothetical protein [Solimicrobium silvestre]PRC95129.1 hypothetical protein S2091_0324 [Solimicrobium silvestre]
MGFNKCIINQRGRSRFTIMMVTLLALAAFTVRAETLIIHPAAESISDPRYRYDWAVLRAAMDETLETFGPYTIQEASERGMVQKRVDYEMQIPTGSINIFVRATSIELEKQFIPIRIPVDRGILSYRVFLVRSADLPRFASVRNLDDLRKFRFGQGKDWVDVRILTSAGFTVIEGTNYDGLFSMLTHARFDVFSRSIDEAFSEYSMQHENHPTMSIEPTLVLHYPLPRYFFVRRNPQGEQFAKRIETGMEMMLRDGSLVKLFFQFKSDQITQAAFAKRTVLNIPNPLLPPETPLSRRELWYDPFDSMPTINKK